MNETIMTVDEVAAYLKIPKRSVYRLVELKKLPAIKIGKLLRFSKIKIDEAIENMK